ncbi:MAG: divalent-cation tolerance protein CutA [Pseudomonadota bacterium]
MTETVAALAWCPFPDLESARDISGALLDERLIGCANILGEIEALFEWEGERSRGTEVAVLFKTNGDILDRLIERLGELHPYDTPAILAWRCDAAHPSTLAWLGDLGAKEQS